MFPLRVTKVKPASFNTRIVHPGNMKRRLPTLLNSVIKISVTNLRANWVVNI